MSITKPPKELYVVSVIRTETEWLKPDYKQSIVTSFNLGFLHPHEPTKATDASKKKTQHTWAYAHRKWVMNHEVYQTSDGEWRERGISYIDGAGYSTTPHEFDRAIPIECAPRIWKNEQLEGFEIIDTVSRYRGNKLFMVQDPRGLLFEISAVSLFNIIQAGTIEKGFIKNPCVWKANKNLIVVE